MVPTLGCAVRVTLVIALLGLCVPTTLARGRDRALLTGGTLAGQPLGPGAWVVHAEAGEPIRGMVLLAVFNAADDAELAVPLGYTWTWGDRDDSIVQIDSRLDPGTNDRAVPIDLIAPSTAGTYYILFGHHGNLDLPHVFSVTTAAELPVVWGDGNDYRDLDADDLSFAHREGYVDDWLLLEADDYRFGEIAVAPLMVVVSLPTR
jgi:hypothetical protein